MGFGIAVHHHGVAGAEGQHVAAHGVELLVRHMDETDAAGFEQFDKAHRHERQVDDREVMVERAQHRHEMEDVAPALVVGHVEPQDFHVTACKFLQLHHAFHIGAVADTGDQRVAVEPDEVAPFQLAVAVDLAGDGEAQALEMAAVHLRLLAALGLAHARLHETVGGHDQRIMGIK